MKKNISSLLTLTGLTLFLFGCGSDDSSATAPVTTTVESSDSAGADIGSLESSSSEVEIPVINYGAPLVDARDGQSYVTVIIGEQTWMARNLNYSDSISTPDLAGNSWCYNNDVSYCLVYGRLYTYTAALTVCPAGSHLPSDREWKTLFSFVGGDNVSGRHLKSTTGWNDGKNVTDKYGFTALPGGLYDDEDGTFIGIGDRANFWTSTIDSYYGQGLGKYFYSTGPQASNLNQQGNQILALSVRCILD